MQKSPAISVTNACVQYQNKVLFDHLNFYLTGAQTTCLLGTSGVGKTSFLRLIAGLNTQRTYADIQADDQKSLQGRMAYMSQASTLLPWLTVLDNVLLGYRLRGNHKPVKRACELLKQLGLELCTLKKYPPQLSGGMQQRVALARILLEDHPVVLMDEPFSALDTMTRYQLQTLTAQTLKGRTVLLITHDPLEALRLGHSTAIMSGCPAEINYVALNLENPPPRSFHDTQLLQWQATLFSVLHQNHYTPCDS